MKIVIELPDKTYHMINAGYYDYGDMNVIIQNGTQLPKGHGRLIDADAFIAMMEDVSKRQKYKKLLIDDCLTVDDVFKAIIESLQNKGLANGDTPTIIEADKTESEDKE